MRQETEKNPNLGQDVEENIKLFIDLITLAALLPSKGTLLVKQGLC